MKLLDINNKMSAGKGDKPRNCFSKKFKDNYDEINWNSDLEDSGREHVKKWLDRLKPLESENLPDK